MTRTEFYERVDSINDIIEVACDYGHWAETIITEDEFDSRVDSDLYDAVRDGDYTWDEIRDYLNDIPTGYELYTCDGWLSYDPVTMDIGEIRDDLFEFLWGNGYIDEEDEEDSCDIDIEYEELEWECDAGECDIPVNDLLASSQETFQEAKSKAEERQKKLNEAFQVLTLGE